MARNHEVDVKESSTMPADNQTPVMVYSADTHIGPRMSDLRPYCPKKYLSDFDEFAASDWASGTWERGMTSMTKSDEYVRGYEKNLQTAGHHDPQARIRDYDRDGVTGGVIFHGSGNGTVFPFLYYAMTLMGTMPSAEEQRLAAVGRSMYNRWLADFCSAEPARHAGLAELPYWDLDAAVRELEWCAENGLVGANFPAPGNQNMRQPYEPEFDAFFEAAAALDMTLATHLGALPQLIMTPDEAAYPFLLVDMAQWGIRIISMLTIFGVFERHPNLKLVVAEVPGVFWDDLAQRMDSPYRSHHRRRDNPLPRLPSEYMATNVWLGTSFMARHEAIGVIEIGREDRFCWGSDYPHPEGTFSYSQDPTEHPMTRLSLANTFHDLPLDKVRKMAGLNLLDAFPRIDLASVAEIAERVGITAKEIATAPDLDKHSYALHLGSCGFRQHGTWD
jgi:predicted TIM-barrel fold metal-dependent hydrolase